jgi:hypothetical protein
MMSENLFLTGFPSFPRSPAGTLPKTFFDRFKAFSPLQGEFVIMAPFLREDRGRLPDIFGSRETAPAFYGVHPSEDVSFFSMRLKRRAP